VTVERLGAAVDCAPNALQRVLCRAAYTGANRRWRIGGVRLQCIEGSPRCRFILCRPLGKEWAHFPGTFDNPLQVAKPRCGAGYVLQSLSAGYRGAHGLSLLE